MCSCITKYPAGIRQQRSHTHISKYLEALPWGIPFHQSNRFSFFLHTFMPSKSKCANNFLFFIYLFIVHVCLSVFHLLRNKYVTSLCNEKEDLKPRLDRQGKRDKTACNASVLCVTHITNNLKAAKKRRRNVSKNNYHINLFIDNMRSFEFFVLLLLFFVLFQRFLFISFSFACLFRIFFFKFGITWNSMKMLKCWKCQFLEKERNARACIYYTRLHRYIFFLSFFFV